MCLIIVYYFYWEREHRLYSIIHVSTDNGCIYISEWCFHEGKYCLSVCHKTSSPAVHFFIIQQQTCKVLSEIWIWDVNFLHLLIARNLSSIMILTHHSKWLEIQVWFKLTSMKATCYGQIPTKHFHRDQKILEVLQPS